MKRYINLLYVIAVICLCAIMFVACESFGNKQYSVTYEGGGATGTAPEPEKHNAGEEFTLKGADVFTKDGSTFNGWNDGEKVYEAGATYTMPEKDVTFTAVWSDNGGEGQNPGGEGQNPGGEGQNPGGEGQNPGGEGQNPGGEGQNPGGEGQNPGMTTALEGNWSGATLNGDMIDAGDVTFDVEAAVKQADGGIYVVFGVSGSIQGDGEPIAVRMSSAMFMRGSENSYSGENGTLEYSDDTLTLTLDFGSEEPITMTFDTWEEASEITMPSGSYTATAENGDVITIDFDNSKYVEVQSEDMGGGAGGSSGDMGGGTGGSSGDMGGGAGGSSGDMGGGTGGSSGDMGGGTGGSSGESDSSSGMIDGGEEDLDDMSIYGMDSIDEMPSPRDGSDDTSSPDEEDQGSTDPEGTPTEPQSYDVRIVKVGKYIVLFTEQSGETGGENTEGNDSETVEGTDGENEQSISGTPRSDISVGDEAQRRYDYEVRMNDYGINDMRNGDLDVNDDYKTIDGSEVDGRTNENLDGQSYGSDDQDGDMGNGNGDMGGGAGGSSGDMGGGAGGSSGDMGGGAGGSSGDMGGGAGGSSGDMGGGAGGSSGSDGQDDTVDENTRLMPLLVLYEDENGSLVGNTGEGDILVFTQAEANA